MKTDSLRRMLRRAGQSVAGLEAEEKASVYSHVQRHTAFLDTVAVAESTGCPDGFDPAELKTGNTTVYLVLPPDQLRAKAPLMRLWVGSMLRACVKGGLGEDKKVYFVLDEAAAVGRLDVLQDALTQYRGYGVRLILAYQALGQLEQCWKRGGDQVVRANTSHVYFGIRDYDTAEAVSKTLGDRTAVKEEWNTSGGVSTSANTHEPGGSVGRNRGAGRSFSQTGRALARPEELINLDPLTAISLTPGVPPVVSRLEPYYARHAAPTRWCRVREEAGVWAFAVGLLGSTVVVGGWLSRIFLTGR